MRKKRKETQAKASKAPPYNLKLYEMIPPGRKHAELQKLSDKRAQPFETSIKDWVKTWRGKFVARNVKVNPAGTAKKKRK